MGAGSRRFKSSRPDHKKQYVIEVRSLPGLICLWDLLAVFISIWPSNTNTIINAKSGNYPPLLASDIIEILNNLMRVSMKRSGNPLSIYSCIPEKYNNIKLLLITTQGLSIDYREVVWLEKTIIFSR